MSSVMKFDKINALDSNRRSEPHKEYFDKMPITYFQRKEKNDGSCTKYSDR